MATLDAITDVNRLPLPLDSNKRGKPVTSAEKIRHTDALPHVSDNDSDSWRAHLNTGLTSAQHSIVTLSDALAALGQNPGGQVFQPPTQTEAAAGYALLVIEANDTAADGDFTPATSSVPFATAPTSAVAIFLRLPVGAKPEGVRVVHTRSGATSPVATFPRNAAEGWGDATISGANPHYNYFALVETDGGDRVNYADVMAADAFNMLIRPSEIDATHTVSAFDDLPPVDIYSVGKLVAAGNLWYKLGFTNADVPNLFEGTVGRDTLNTTGGEHWRGISTSLHPNGFATDGGFTANPDNAVSFILASDQRHIRWAIKKSVFDAAKGSAFVTTDRVAIKITYPDSSRIDEAVGAYYSSYSRNDGSRDVSYIIFSHRNPADDPNGRTWDDGVDVRMGENTPTAVAGAPNGDIAVAGTTLTRIQFWNGTTWYRFTAFPTGEASILGVAFRSNGRMIAAGGNTDKIYTFDGASWDSGIDTPSADGTPAAIAESQAGHLLFLGSQTRKVYTHNGTSWDSGVDIESTETHPTGLAVDPGNGDWLITGTGTKKIWRRPLAGGNWTEEAAVPTGEELPQGLGFTSAGDLVLVGVTTKKLYRYAIQRYHLYSEPAQSLLTAEFFTVDGDGMATTTHFLTHSTQLKHWTAWNESGDPTHDVEAIALSNRARLDALDVQLGGVTPDQTRTLTSELALDGTTNFGFASRNIMSPVAYDDLVVMEWTDMTPLDTSHVHFVAGSSDAAGILYFRAGDLGTNLDRGHIGTTLNVNRQASDNSADPAGTRADVEIAHNGGLLYIELNLTSSSNRHLKPAAGWSLRIDIYENATAASVTNTIAARINTLQTTLAALDARVTALEEAG